MWYLERKLTRILVFCSIIGSVLQPHLSFGKEMIQVPKKHFLLQIRGKYGTQISRLFQEGKKWICQTELLPYFESSQDPLKGIDWAAIVTDSKEAQVNCRDRVFFEDRRKSPVKKIATCLSSKATLDVVQVINQGCGRY